MNSEFKSWSMSVFAKHQELFESKTKNISQAIFLNCITCASWLVKFKSGKPWLTCSYKKMAEALKMSERAIARYMKEMEEAGLIQRKKNLIDRKIQLKIKVTPKLSKLTGFVNDEVNLLSPEQAGLFALDLIPTGKAVFNF